MRSIVGSILFFLYAVLYTPVHATVLLVLSPVLSIKQRYIVACYWNLINIKVMKFLCGIDYKVEGMEHLPNTGAIILAKHQSAWETFAIPANLLPQHQKDPWVLASIELKELYSTLRMRHQPPMRKHDYRLLN